MTGDFIRGLCCLGFFLLLSVICVILVSETVYDWLCEVAFQIRIMITRVQAFLIKTKKHILRQDMSERMHELCCLLIKFNYLKFVCRNPATTDTHYFILLDELRDLEDKYPLHAKPYSPSRIIGFDEVIAQQCYGQEWETLKCTLDLLKKEEEVNYGF